MKQLILASQSPRRSEILKKAGYQFVSFPVYVSEIPNKKLTLDDQIIDIANRKAEACLQNFTDKSLDALVIASDTMVCIEDEALGKPNDVNEAFLYLERLSGKIHQVKTSLVVVDLLSSKKVSHLETTHVSFKQLTEKEIHDYIKTGEPMDKAGAYAIQGLGSNFVTKYEGDFNNVVGLPLLALENLFRINQWTVLKIPT